MEKRDEAKATLAIMPAGTSLATTTDIQTSASGASSTVSGTIVDESEGLQC